MEIFLYKRPAKTEQTLSSLTTILFRLTCISVFGLFFAQIVFFNGGLLPFIDLTKSTLLMYPIQFTLLLTAIAALWNEFEPSLISVKDVRIKTEKIAGVKTPGLDEVIYDVKEFDLFKKPLF